MRHIVNSMRSLSSSCFRTSAAAGRRLIEKGWDCHEYIATIISGIADYEDGVIDTILCAVQNSRCH